VREGDAVGEGIGLGDGEGEAERAGLACGDRLCAATGVPVGVVSTNVCVRVGWPPHPAKTTTMASNATLTVALTP
jgi:hypothetical protein